MSEREAINTSKQQFVNDLSAGCKNYLSLSWQTKQEEKTGSPRLAQDEVTLARSDIAFAELKLGSDPETSVILYKDAQQRIKVASNNGADVRELQKEADKLRPLLPACTIEK